ncbi:sialic acid-binding Ig-like lectin 14 isoform X1 [Marmota marmota marmota]|uniref:Sialic acid-binding Ig-like lectin 14 n=1 Tax=Marmota marmota marmota TaxID=9994 RepID=A0A8C6EYK4_MARMA|nr:sialic acid-binding Ig-like lectin 14 isoform X1 [Marmota marmota marmota]
MLPLLLLPLLWAGSLQEDAGYKLQLQESVTVQAGLCALVPCSFSYPWSGWSPPSKLYIYWIREGDRTYYDGPVATNNPDMDVRTEHRNRFHLPGDVRDNNCSLLIRDAKKKDTGSYVLMADIGWNTRYAFRDKKLTLQVTALTEKPVIHSLEPLESGRPTSLSCRLPGSCEGGRPLQFSWTGAVTSSMAPGALQSSVLSLTPRPQDHDTNLTCQVKLQGSAVTTESTVQLNVSYAPQNLSIRILFGNGTAFLEGQALVLCCAADSNPAAQLNWFQRSSTQNVSQVSDTGLLDLPRGGAAEGEAFTCRAQNALGSHSVSVRLSYPPRLLGPSCSWEAQALLCSCSSRAWPAPSLHWRLGEGLLEGNSSNASLRVTSSSEGPWANSSLSLHGALSSDLRLSCEAQNAQGTQSATVLLLPGRSRPGVLLAALGGAGAGALLSLCLCLVFFCIVKSCRKHGPGKPEVMDDRDPVMDTVPWGPRQKSCPDSSGDQACPAGGAVPPGKQEMHYATLSFHGTSSAMPRGREATSSTDYSEIRTSK